MLSPSPTPTPNLSPSTPPTLTLPSMKQATPVSLEQIVISKPSINKQSSVAETENVDIKRPRKPPVLQHPRPRRTNMFMWCCASVCLIFSLILIFFGIVTLIIFLVIKPRSPVFDTPNASLNTIYFDSPGYFNGDFTFLANFSNPNRKIGVRFEFLEIELYFFNRLIATQAVQPFSQQPREQRLESVHMISSLVFMPQDHAVEWLHSRCQLEMTGPPTGVLVAHSCQTKR